MSGVTTNSLLLAVLLAVSIASASADEPPRADDKLQVDPPAASTTDVKCPCADDYAAAVAAYDARPGIQVHPQWEVCSVPRGSVGKYGAHMSKFDALTPAQDGRTTTIFLTAAKRRTLWGTRPVECSAWVMIDTVGIPKNIFDAGMRDKLSDAELAACEKLIRAVAKCPGSEPPAQSPP